MPKVRAAACITMPGKRSSNIADTAPMNSPSSPAYSGPVTGEEAAPGVHRPDEGQHQQERGLVDRAVQGHRAGIAADHGAGAQVEEGGVAECRIAAAHAVVLDRGKCLQASIHGGTHAFGAR